jgi:K(+)-stimulated pyrophosphate-energized sodium pump
VPHLQNPIVPFAFLTGGLFSGLCGFIGMKTATNASARTTYAASQSLNSGLQVALRAGAVMGLVVVGFALLDITAWFLLLYNASPVLFPESFISLAENPLPQITAVMLSFGMGASTQALFARVGGGIYTKAADVGADLVGKVEANIPEDDPRNPATIADNVGDNVGDVAGMGADLYESYAGSILATSALGVAAVGLGPARAGASPLELGCLYRRPDCAGGVGHCPFDPGALPGALERGCDPGRVDRRLSRGLYVSSAGIAVLALPLLLFPGPPQLVVALDRGPDRPGGRDRRRPRDGILHLPPSNPPASSPCRRTPAPQPP